MLLSTSMFSFYPCFADVLFVKPCPTRVSNPKNRFQQLGYTPQLEETLDALEQPMTELFRLGFEWHAAYPSVRFKMSVVCIPLALVLSIYKIFCVNNSIGNSRVTARYYAAVARVQKFYSKTRMSECFDDHKRLDAEFASCRREINAFVSQLSLISANNV